MTQQANSKPKPTNVVVRLMEVSFVPSWSTFTADGTETKHTVIGQRAISCADLPVDVQNLIRNLCQEAWEAYIGVTK